VELARAEIERIALKRRCAEQSLIVFVDIGIDGRRPHKRAVTDSRLRGRCAQCEHRARCTPEKQFSPFHKRPLIPVFTLSRSITAMSADMSPLPIISDLPGLASFNL